MRILAAGPWSDLVDRASVVVFQEWARRGIDDHIAVIVEDHIFYFEFTGIHTK